MRFSGPIPYLKCNFLRLTSSHLSPERLTNRQDRCLKIKESYADHVDFGGLGFLEAAQGPEIGGVPGRSGCGTDTYPLFAQTGSYAQKKDFIFSLSRLYLWSESPRIVSQFRNRCFTLFTAEIGPGKAPTLARQGKLPGDFTVICSSRL